MAGIRGRKLRKAYRLQDEREVLALEGVDLDIRSGEFVCLLGPSGCGKTTLLNILSGLDQRYEGAVEFLANKEPGQKRNAPVISYMFQDSRLLPWLTVRENIRFVMDGDRRSRGANEEIETWLERVGLAGHGDFYPLQLSIGMQQRVAVARALIIQPSLLLMDEPFSSLDELTALKMRTELLELWAAQSCTVVFVTHNPLEAVYLADRVIIMSPGPGRITDSIELGTELPRPRNVEDKRLWEISRQAVHKLMGVEKGLKQAVHG